MKTINVPLLVPTTWQDYALLDTGGEGKLEKYGPYVVARPDSQAIWHRRLPVERWEAGADAIYEKGAGESGSWIEHRPIPPQWPMRFDGLTFYCRLTPFRHTGVFPEQAVHWRWIRQMIETANRPIKMLDLFAYTGLSTLAAAEAGAQVTYVDASRPALTWARENQIASGLQDKPIRWILDDALKFVRREIRRGVRYDALVMDPPVFGRGPEGEIWRFYESVPILLDLCRQVLSPQPRFVIINAYALDLSPSTLYNLLDDLMVDYPRGHLEAGELGLQEKGGGRVMAAGMYGRWCEEAR